MDRTREDGQRGGLRGVLWVGKGERGDRVSDVDSWRTQHLLPYPIKVYYVLFLIIDKNTSPLCIMQTSSRILWSRMRKVCVYMEKDFDIPLRHCHIYTNRPYGDSPQRLWFVGRLIVLSRCIFPKVIRLVWKNIHYDTLCKITYSQGNVWP